jgi:hypothetical protein
MANSDKMKLALNGINENAGGRPSATPITNIFNESGKPAHKTAKSLTLLDEHDNLSKENSNQEPGCIYTIEY